MNDIEKMPVQQANTTKKRVGRPRKNPLPEKAAAPNPETAPKTRGRPRAVAATQAPATTATRRTRVAAETANESKPNTIKIATNSTTIRSNLLRGPAKKKTVTFQEFSDSEGDDSSVSEAPVVGRRRATPKAAGAGKDGLGATPVRKSATAGARGRKLAANKKDVAVKPLSPKKDKQVAKSLSAYASSDDEDELNTIKADIPSPIKLTVHSNAKRGPEQTGLSSPVRRINFTPQKPASFVDENGEPKLPTPKRGSERTGLSSPVRRINFTPNRSRNTDADDGCLALPPGNSLNLGDSGFMLSPARRAPTSSPFKFSLRDNSNHGGSLFSAIVNPVAAPDLAPGHASPLKMSPKKANLGASFSESAFKSSAAPVPTRTPLFQSPAKRIASPFKTSIFSTQAPLSQSPDFASDEILTKVAEPEGTTTLKTSPRSYHDDITSGRNSEESDTELVKDVARDIFDIDIEFSTDAKSPSPSLPQREITLPGSEDQSTSEHLVTELETGKDSGSEEEEGNYSADEEEAHYQEPETLCFDVMEEGNLAPATLYDQPTEGDSDIEQEGEVPEPVHYEYEEAETLCFDVMEDDQVESEHLYDDQFQHDTGSEHGSFIQDVPPFQYEEASTLCFDDMEDQYFANYDQSVQMAQSVESERSDTEEFEEEHSESELESGDEVSYRVSAVPQSPERNSQSIEAIEMEDTDVEDYAHQEAMSDHTEGEDNESVTTTEDSPLSPINTSQPQDSASPAQSIQSFSSPAPSSPTGEAGAGSIHWPDNTKNDFNSTPRGKNADDRHVHHPLGEVSYTPASQVDSPTLMIPSVFNTPSVAGQDETPAETDLGFTPLAARFGRWEQNTPSQARSLRPRRRGVFSLVGPLDRTSVETPVHSGSVSYPDLSKSPLANTPSLFAELPLQPQSDDTRMSPEHDETPRPPKVHEHRSTPASSNERPLIFEDPVSEISEPQFNHPGINNNGLEAQTSQSFEVDDKENHGFENPPLTPIQSKSQTEDLRTVHTVSKVPLKAEGVVSPLKMSRKRGLSFSIASPTRSSPRVRKHTLMPLNDNVPVLSPTRKTPRATASPTTKRRSIMARRSSGRGSAIATPNSPVASGSPSKKPRRSIGTEQKALHGAVVHVDVHTTEGEDASGIFVELLQQMGARCVKSWSWNPSSSLSPVDGADPKDLRVGITHVVYKDGGLRTLEKVKKAAGLVKCVGVGWVLE